MDRLNVSFNHKLNWTTYLITNTLKTQSNKTKNFTHDDMIIEITS